MSSAVVIFNGLTSLFNWLNSLGGFGNEANLTSNFTKRPIKLYQHEIPRLDFQLNQPNSRKITVSLWPIPYLELLKDSQAKSSWLDLAFTKVLCTQGTYVIY